MLIQCQPDLLRHLPPPLTHLILVLPQLWERPYQSLRQSRGWRKAKLLRIAPGCYCPLEGVVGHYQQLLIAWSFTVREVMQNCPPVPVVQIR